MKYQLDFDHPNIQTDEISIIGIATYLGSSNLAQFINSNNNISLSLNKDFEVYDKERRVYFRHFYYYCPLYRIHYLLISNKNIDDNLLIKDFKNIDYVLILFGEDNQRHAKKISSSLKTTDNINLSKIIHPESSKSNNQDKVEVQEMLDLFQNTVIIKPKNQKKKAVFDQNNLINLIYDIDYNIQDLMNTKKLFIAYKISLNESLTGIIKNIQNKYIDEKINYTSIENFHMTIVFIGERPVSTTLKINNAINEALKNIDTDEFENISIEIDKIGVFGFSYEPKVIWFGIKENETLYKIYNAIRKVFEEEKIEFSTQNFLPHITIGKIRNLREKKNFTDIVKELWNIEPQKIELKNLSLLESVHMNNTIRYDIISSY